VYLSVMLKAFLEPATVHHAIRKDILITAERARTIITTRRETTDR
jgi:hypothetical protein